jgi:hypothetical protein
MRRSKTIMRQIFAPEDLKQFEGWEIRKINTSDYKPGIIMQNPDTGEKRKLLFTPSLFDGEYLKVIRGKGQPSARMPIDKKESD